MTPFFFFTHTFSELTMKFMSQLAICWFSFADVYNSSCIHNVSSQFNTLYENREYPSANTSILFVFFFCWHNYRFPHSSLFRGERGINVNLCFLCSARTRKLTQYFFTFFSCIHSCPSINTVIYAYTTGVLSISTK